MNRPCLALFSALALLLAGCAQLNVRHLERQPWQPHEKKSLLLEFWRFDYEPMAQTDKYGVSGRAYPITKGLPEWATHIDELWFAVYLNDSPGRVLAKDVQVMPPADLTPEILNRGIPFSFTLRPEDIGQSGQLYVTFGYRMVLTPPKNAAPKKPSAQPRVFFANEGALSHQ